MKNTRMRQGKCIPFPSKLYGKIIKRPSQSYGTIPLKGHSHETLCEIIALDYSFDQNHPA
jgi:hypothetical protein